jgi:hypothetical protein
VPDLTLIVAAFGEYEASFAMSEPIGKGTCVVAAVFEEELSETVRFFVLPFSPIDDSG